MLCQRCKQNTATITRSESINGKSHTFYYCQQCYSDLFGSLFSHDNDMWAGLFAEKVKPKRQCPVCHTTYADYEQTGLLGCATCYDVFKQELLPSIQRIHGKVRHVGKVGKNYNQHDLMRELKTLQEGMESAIKNKRFVEAGKINTRISEITKILYGEEGGENE